MLFQGHPYVIPLTASAIINGGISILVWLRRSRPGARALAIISMGAAIWSAASALVWASTNLDSQIFWLNFGYLGALVVPVFFLVFALDYAENASWATPRHLIWLGIEPALAMLAIWTNPFHHLFHHVLRMEQRSSFLVLYWEPGVLFWVNAIYSYVLILIALILLLRIFRQSKGEYRTQAGILIAGSLIPCIANIFFSRPGNSLFYQLDITPIAFSVLAVFFSYALFRFRLFNLVPIARSLIIEKISDSVVILDEKNRVADINAAARELTGFHEDSIGRDNIDIFSMWLNGTMQAYRNERQAHAEIKASEHPLCYFELQIDPLYDGRNNFIGRVLILRDITTRKQSEEELKDAHGNLQKQFAEVLESESQLREQAIRDPLTGVYNRRFMEDALLSEFSKARVGDYPVSAMILDLDHFKVVNDTYGHEAGDLVLVTLANQLLEETRKSDIVCRYGGEEFVVVMPSASLEQAFQRVEQWRIHFGKTKIPYKNSTIVCTFSAGLVSFPEDGDAIKAIFNAADEALYKAKHSGRNRVVTSHQN